MALLTRTAKLDHGAHGARCARAKAVHHAVGIRCQRNSGYRPSMVNIMAQGLSTPDLPLSSTYFSKNKGRSRNNYTTLLLTLVHAFITSRVDYCNAVLYGIAGYVLRRLKSVLNAAARLITGVRRYEHIMPTLRDTPLVACTPAHNVQNCADGFRLRSWPMSGILQ